MLGFSTVTRRLVVRTRLWPGESKNKFLDILVMLAFIPEQEDLDHKEIYRGNKRVIEESISALTWMATRGYKGLKKNHK